MSVDGDRLKQALADLVEAQFPRLKYLGFFEYRITSDYGATVDATPVDAAAGMPNVARIPKRPPILGGSSLLNVGDSVVMGFLDGNPTKPFIAYGDPSTVPQTIALAGGGPASARVGDIVAAGYLVVGPTGSLAGYFPYTTAGLAAATTLATSIGGSVITMADGRITSGSSILAVGP